MEKWKPVKGYRGLYEVSNRGRVRSLPRVIVRSNGAKQTVGGRILSCKPFGKHGYVQVNLSDTSNGKGGAVFVHVLVATAFLEKPEDADRVCHKDDVGSNNRVKNLYWGTAATNGKDAYRNGKHDSKVMPKGGQVYNATPVETIQRIRRLHLKGWTMRKISERCEVSIDTVRGSIKNTGRFAEVPWN